MTTYKAKIDDKDHLLAYYNSFSKQCKTISV